MQTPDIGDCRACLAISPADKVTFESLKDVFVELTLLEAIDTIELPKYLCRKCVEMLTQFKNFKKTCIESDKRLRDVTLKTICDDEDLLVELSTSQPPKRSKRTKKPRMEENNAINKIKEGSKKPRMNDAEKANIKTEVESANEIDDLYEIYEINKTPKTKKKQTRKKRKTLADAKKDVKIIVKTAREDGSDDSKEWDEPLKKKEKSGDKSKPRLYRCTVPKCKNKFHSEFLLETHLKTHETGIESSICDICGRPLISVHSMLRHRETHKSAEERQFKCDICNKVMIHENSLRYHKRTHEKSKSFVCDMCGMGFGTSWGLKNHRKTHNTEHSFQCQQCPKSYTTYSTLYLHIKAKHEQKEESAQCNICGQVVQSKRYLFSHCKNMHTVYTSTDNLYQCIQCDVKFKSMKVLKTHERLHTGERKYKCPLCPKSYAHSTILKRHSYTHTGERPVHCEECGKGFLQKYALDIHMKVHGKESKRPKKRVIGTSDEESMDSLFE